MDSTSTQVGIQDFVHDFKIVMTNTDHIKMYTAVSYCTLILLIMSLVRLQSEHDNKSSLLLSPLLLY